MSASIEAAVTLTMTIMPIKIEKKKRRLCPLGLPCLICLCTNVAVTSGWHHKPYYCVIITQAQSVIDYLVNIVYRV